MDDVDVPVLVVGGGGCGLAASIFLSDVGVRHLLVERRESETDHRQDAGDTDASPEVTEQASASVPHASRYRPDLNVCTHSPLTCVYARDHTRDVNRGEDATRAPPWGRRCPCRRLLCVLSRPDAAAGSGPAAAREPLIRGTDGVRRACG